MGYEMETSEFLSLSFILQCFNEHLIYSCKDSHFIMKKRHKNNGNRKKTWRKNLFFSFFFRNIAIECLLICTSCETLTSKFLINGSENTEPSINFILFSYESISFRSLFKRRNGFYQWWR